MIIAFLFSERNIINSKLGSFGYKADLVVDLYRDDQHTQYKNREFFEISQQLKEEFNEHIELKPILKDDLVKYVYTTDTISLECWLNVYKNNEL